MDDQAIRLEMTPDKSFGWAFARAQELIAQSGNPQSRVHFTFEFAMNEKPVEVTVSSKSNKELLFRDVTNAFLLGQAAVGPESAAILPEETIRKIEEAREAGRRELKEVLDASDDPEAKGEHMPREKRNLDSPRRSLKNIRKNGGNKNDFDLGF